MMTFKVLLGSMALACGILATTPPTAASAAPLEKGVSVMVYDSWGSDAEVTTAADATFAYLESLGANATSITFPIFMKKLTSSSITTGPTTPSEVRLALIVDSATSHHLSVQLRPMIDETSFAPGGWRGVIAPNNVASWFASYTALLEPYMAMAHDHGVNRFVIGSELTSMVRHRLQWKPLVAEAKTITGADVAFDANWEPVEGLRHAGFGLDFYRPTPFKAGVTPTVAQLVKKMHLNLTTIGGGTFNLPPVPLNELVLSEVGVAAVSGSWNFPYETYSNQVVTIRRSVQARWFTAACQVAKQDHLRGIYYWTVFLAPWASPSEDDNAYPFQWVGTTSANAIRDCFTAP